MWKVILAIWGCTAIAVCVAIYCSHSPWFLWFMLIPACMNIKYNENTEAEKELERLEEKITKLEKAVKEHNEWL